MNKKRIAVLFVLSGILIFQLCIFIIIKFSSESSMASTPEPVLNINTTQKESEILNAGIPDTTEIILNTEQKIEALIENMTLEQKVGQMFFCAFRQDNAGNDIVEIDENIKNIIKDCGIGGVVLFSENIKDINQVTEYIRDLQNEAGITLFIGIDEEGGRVLRTDSLNVPRIASALSTGSSGDAQKAYDSAKTVAGYLKPLGFNLDFAPVADVFTNPSNTVIGDRAFSTEPDTAAEMVKYFSQGLLDNGILPVLKHFPGHGDTSEDSHYGTAITKKSLDELYECEFIPFKTGIETNVPFVMAGHIATPNINIENNNLPAIFSDFLLRDILRDKLGFNGIIITDSLSMGAIINYYTSEETAVKSILSGVDMLLMPEDFNSAYHGVINAVKSGEIPEEQINGSVKRILAVKYESGLIDLD